MVFFALHVPDKRKPPWSAASLCRVLGVERRVGAGWVSVRSREHHRLSYDPSLFTDGRYPEPTDGRQYGQIAYGGMLDGCRRIGPRPNLDQLDGTWV